MLNRRNFAASAGVLLAAPALAQGAWAPSRPIRLVVAYPAGGPTDAIARFVAQDIGTRLGQNVVVENVAGGAGAVGTRQVAKADPDGHTITFGNNQTHGNNMFMLKTPGYDAVKDFVPLVGTGSFEHLFVARTDLEANGIQDLIALAKKDPGKLNYGSTGLGSGSHLSMEMFMAKTAIQMAHIPYRGAPPLVTDLMGGRVDVANSTLPSVLAQVEGGKMKALAISSPKRNARLPQVQTLSEQGVTGADAASWTAFFAPAATPEAAVRRLSSEIITALRKPDVVASIDKLGFSIELRDGATFRPYQQAEIDRWAQIARAAQVKQEEG